MINTSVIVILEAHVEEDDEGWHAPANLMAMMFNKNHDND